MCSSDLNASYKFGTADAAVGLGTGRNDWSVQGDLFRTFGTSLTGFATAGYRVLGSPAGSALRDIAFAMVGAGYQFSDALNAGAVVNFRQATFAGGEPAREMTAYAGYKLTAKTTLQAYVTRGFSDGSPDWGTGVNLTFGF